MRSLPTTTAMPKCVTVGPARSLPCDAVEEDVEGAADVANLQRARRLWLHLVTKKWFPPSSPKKALSGLRTFKLRRKSFR